MAISPTDAPVYTDLAGLSALKRGAASKDPSAIREVARQFESMFTGMMLKSMRDATGPDPVFGSDQQQMYQSMFDDQLALQMSRGKGLGLADLLVRQLQKMGAAGASGATADNQSGATSGSAQTGASNIPARSSRAGATAYIAAQAIPSPEQQSFVRSLWPQAQQAGQQLGVDPRSLIAQAALESNWGRDTPQDASSGTSSNNLFGVKASRGWAGPTVTASTQEYQSGVPMGTQAQFRSYASPGESFQDYVALLQSSPRYSGALNTGGDVHAFASGLQRGGYATDPDYVRKIGAVAQNVAGALAHGAADVTDLKSANDQPITQSEGADQGPTSER